MAVTWTDAAEIRKQLGRRWDRGDLLRSVATGDGSSFPLRLSLKAPGAADVTDRFELVRKWIADLSALAHVRIEWQEVRHRVLGAQRIPVSIWIDTLDDALALLGKRAQAARLSEVVTLTRARKPALLVWIEKRPLEAVDLADRWARLLDVVEWMERHPTPGVYLRQVDVRGVDTKFVEAHLGVLAEWMALVQPQEGSESEAGGASQFLARRGFLAKPVRIRFRVLDEAHAVVPVRGVLTDLALDAESFALLEPTVRRVFITENEINFLAFPPVADSMVLFGSGYGWEALAKARWLQQRTIFYWGDIDTHGFSILDQLRARFAHVDSLLMDRATLFEHEASWGEEESQTVRDLPRLGVEEARLYDELRDNRIRPRLRLEQERIGFEWVAERLRKL